MTEWQKTFAYLGIALLAGLSAWAAAPRTARVSTAIIDPNLGQAFYPGFTDPLAAKSLEVVSYNSELAEARVFKVEFRDGAWRIPSRLNYPADGKDRLAKTATSMIGIQRSAPAGYRKTQHEEFQVVDPLDESSESITGRGQRIRLQDEAGKVLAEFIIGREVPNRRGHFYVRRADEDLVYIAKLELSLSTKFADWIEPDLLKLDQFQLNSITVDKYSVDREAMVLAGKEVNELTRKTSSDPWVLKDLDPATEELNTAEVTKLVQSLDDLKIVGVRKKPAKLVRDLRNNDDLSVDLPTQLDLESKGFLFARTSRNGPLTLIPTEGSVYAATDQGVVYVLKFGSVFSGTDDEVEFGFAKDENAADDASGGSKEAASGDKPGKSKKAADEPLKKSRYLFVTAEFDPDKLGPKPEAPVKPEPPAKPADDAAADPANPAADPAAPASPPAKSQAEIDYEVSLKKYELDQQKYQADLKAYEGKVAEGEKKVRELNNRFADWYYVVGGESFEELRQGRKTLVKAKSAAPSLGEPGGDPSAEPARGPSESGAVESETPGPTGTAAPGEPAKGTPAAEEPVGAPAEPAAAAEPEPAKTDAPKPESSAPAAEEEPKPPANP